MENERFFIVEIMLENDKISTMIVVNELKITQLIYSSLII